MVRFGALVVAAALSLTGGLLAGGPVAAQDSSGERDQGNRTLEDIGSDQEAVEDELDRLVSSDERLEADLRETERELRNGRRDLRRAREWLRNAEGEITRLLHQTVLAQRELELQQLLIEERAVAVYVNPNVSQADPVLESGSVNDAAERTALVGQVAEHDRDVLSERDAAAERVASRRTEVDRLRHRLETTRADAAREVERLEDLEAELDRRRRRLDARIRAFRAEAEALAAEEDRLAAQIQQWVQTQAEAAARAAEASRPATSVGPSAEAGTPAPGADLIWPTSGTLTSPFGQRWGRLHAGIDIGAPTGTPIWAAADGRVIFSGWMNGYGNAVIVDHGGGLTTLYAHQSRRAAVVGDQLAQGAVLGYVGSTGNSTGPHLHFETRRNGTAVNPMIYL